MDYAEKLGNKIKEDMQSEGKFLLVIFLTVFVYTFLFFGVIHRLF